MSENACQTGGLYVCATPIGNLEDISLRVLRVLQEVDLIAAEDTRHSLKLLNHYSIKTPLTSYHEHNAQDKGKKLLDKLLSGTKIALVSDAGMPGISDPGTDLIHLCRINDIPITICPGATAGITALVLSGMDSRRYVFEGFLPHGKAGKKKRKAVIDSLVGEHRTIVLYEAPHRLVSTMQELKEHLGDRQVSAVRELTKKYEEIKQGSLSELAEFYTENPPRGEFVLIIEAAPQTLKNWPDDIVFHVEHYMQNGMKQMDAIKQAAKDRGVSKSKIYSQYINQAEASDEK